MRAVIQRVASAGVTVEGEVVAKIGRGLCVLLGIERDDTDDDIAAISNKLVSLRLWEKDQKPWNANVKDVDGELLIVSQFTLHAVLKGTRPDFHRSMAPTNASAMFDKFVQRVRKLYPRTQQGVFGAMMEVDVINSGPVTILIDTAERRKPASAPKPSALDDASPADSSASM